MIHILLEIIFRTGICALPAMGYVTSSNSFPKQLSLIEEADYLEKYKNGDQDARNILIERNIRLVAHISKKYATSSVASDDLISIGTIGLIKAISTFDSTKGSRLATYAVRCIENEILMYIRSTKKHQLEVSLQEPIGTDKEGNEISLSDLLSNDDENIVDEVDLSIQIGKLYTRMNDVLKERERVIIELRYGLMNGVERTQKEIGKMFGISRSYVSRIEKKALKKLQVAMDVQ